ncbi:MAG: histidine kinase [Chitinophagaceae bacterium]|nr:histidine kinase [Chitinophagaceae bacterium]
MNTLNYLTLLADSNNIWAGSSKGLTFIGQDEKHKNRILNFTEADGFIKPGYSYVQLCQGKDGIIFAATINGLSSFNPHSLIVPYRAPLVYITDIAQLNTNTTLINDRSMRHSFLYKENSFRFGFTALDYSDPEGLHYYYQLEGVDTIWKETGKHRFINYEYLNPGNYVFKVKALNSKGKWSEQEARYSFSISKPLWQRWWFVGLIFVLIVSGIYYYIKRREENIKHKEQQNTELQTVKAQSYQYQLEMTQIINYFSNSIHNQNNVDELLWDITKNCIAALDFEDCVIYLKDEKRNVLVQKAAWGLKTTEENKILNPLEIKMGKGIVGNVAATGNAEIINDTSNDSRYITDDAVRYSEITVPIVSNGNVIGVIDSEHPEKNFYKEKHFQILSTIASLCADKIEKIKTEQKAKETEIEVLQLSKDLATSQLTVLRAQMNPHFIFNCLNSIQQYILKGNVDEANRYLSRFSKLQREILMNGTQQFIFLEKEIELLTLYLQLEQLRFENTFTYTIHTASNIDASEIKIPTMILQPYIENAIWHGLIPKSGDKNIEISFILLGNEYLQCRINDNGIGRKASALLKANSTAKEHISLGQSLVQDRLKILEQQFQKKYEVSILDNLDDNAEITGTLVTLVLYIGD